MKKEEFKKVFDDTMNELPEDLLTEEPAGRKISTLRRRVLFYTALGLAAAAAVVIGLILGPKTIRKTPETAGVVQASEREGAEKGDGQTMRPTALVRAEYPERVVTTAEYNEALYTKKFEETRQRRELAAEYRGKLDAFMKTAVQSQIGAVSDENPVVSPANFYLALSLLAEASDGATREEVLNVLGISSVEELRKITSAFWNANYDEGAYETCRFASSVWLNQGLPYREDRLLTFRDQYYASIFQGKMGDPDYDRALRDWINDETGKLLSDGIENLSMDPRGVMNLVTTVYYKAVWGQLFDPEKTEQGLFHGSSSDSEVSYMRNDGNMSAYYAGKNFAAVSQTVGDSGEMLFFLPDEGVDVRSLASDEEALSLMIDSGNARYEKWEDRTSYPILHLWLPKFDLSAENDLSECMKSIGIEKAFLADDADFSGILDTDDPVFLSQVQNNIRIAIDENGVTAASMIDMMLAGAGMPEDEIDFRLDRPFMFALRSGMGDLLFVGIVEQF